MSQEPPPIRSRVEARAHIPVLLDGVRSVLAPRPGEVYLDCTAGLGGHAAALAPLLAPGGRVILNDADPANLAAATGHVRQVAPDTSVTGLQGNFALLPHHLESAGLLADLVLADLGFASNQMDDPRRGLSFSHDGPLDMRLDPTLPATAADLVASLPEAELARIIADYGEDRHARRIARRLVEARTHEPISTTGRLARIVRAAAGPSGGIDPATRTFQALRIAVNDELGSLEAILAAITRDAKAIAQGKRGRWLAPHARVAVITFHSLEDRSVKHAFAGCELAGAVDLTNGPRPASESEQRANPRSRSAKLRAIRLPATKT
ncbi:Ribosomal RNA small subunit methyltransferase H [Phycisphaerales bacterium]|nr:Ribosomal RNA small subunit methyltransferase H [Phycisphaerales bacterium]